MGVITLDPICGVAKLKGVIAYIPGHEMTHREIIEELLGGIEQVRKHAFTNEQIRLLKRRFETAPQLEGMIRARLIRGVENLFYCIDNKGHLFCQLLWYEEGRVTDTNLRGQTVTCPDCKWHKVRLDIEEDASTEYSRYSRVFRNTILTI